MNLRQLKALEIAARTQLAYADGVWTVPSASGDGPYRVVLDAPGNRCTCDDFLLRGADCKHILAARLVAERERHGPALALDTDALPTRPTYRQNWPAYNQAQTTEKHRFRSLLYSLCQGLVAPVQVGPGRRCTPLADTAFAVVFKVYSTLSSRRFSCDLSDAHALGYLSQPGHYNCVNGYLKNPLLTAALRRLLWQSSLPLATVETCFAIDSSGFSSSRWVRWYDEKHGRSRPGHDWVKAHLICGVQTNIVAAAEVLARDSADAPRLPGLLEATRRHFTVKELSGDKAYSSVENVEAVFAAAGFPYLPFKANATGGAGGLWQELYCFFLLFRQEFLEHYHKRSNVEATFSMIKRKFGDHLRSRTDVAMRNEALSKIVCHNLCCLIQAQSELGIVPTFWQEPEAAPTASERTSDKK